MSFIKYGVENLGIVFKKNDCKKLIKEVYKTRNFRNIFLSKNEWQSGKLGHFKQNPGPGRNLLDKLETKFIFDNKILSRSMSKVLGKTHRVLDSKFVVGLPEDLIPKWILDKKKNDYTINLGEFIKPKYRDVTYFMGIDFHQDIIDWPTRSPDFITAYIYLNDIDKDSAPIFVVPKSHLLGASTSLHKLKKIKSGKLKYFANDKTLIANHKILKGKTGSLFYWHPFILHGTQPCESKIPRISVRILLEKKERIYNNCLLDKVNKKILTKVKTLNKYNLSHNKKGNFINSLN